MVDQKFWYASTLGQDHLSQRWRSDTFMGPHNNFFRKKSCFLNNLSLDHFPSIYTLYLLHFLSLCLLFLLFFLYFIFCILKAYHSIATFYFCISYLVFSNFVFLLILFYFVFHLLYFERVRSGCCNGALCISEPSTPPSLSERPVTVPRDQAKQQGKKFRLSWASN